MSKAIFSQSSVRETVLSKDCLKDRLSTFLSRSFSNLSWRQPDGSQLGVELHHRDVGCRPEMSIGRKA